jgi:hypothetical protein
MKAPRIAVALLVALAACSDKSKSAAAADSNLARDLALAGAQPVNPTFQDTAVSPAPVQAGRAKEQPPEPVRARASLPPLSKRPAPVAQLPVPQPAPAPVAQAPIVAPAPGPARGEIGSGTGVALTSGSKVCTTNLPGDKFVATVNNAITGSNGAVIPAGSSVVLEVASVNPGQNGDPQITLRVRAIVVNDKTYDVTADVVPEATLVKSKVENADPNADKKKVIGGAIAGAILGQMIGHNTKGTVIGAATGAAAGAAAAKVSEKWQGCLPAGSPLRLTLNQSLVMS